MNRWWTTLGLLSLSQVSLAADSAPDLNAVLERLARLEAKLGQSDASPSASAPNTDASADSAQIISELSTRLAILERKLEIQQEDAAAKAPITPVVAVNEKGLSIKSAGAGEYEIKLKGLAQFDYRAFIDDGINAGSDTSLFRRLRPSLEGSIGSLIGFRITPELAEDQTSLIDAYVDVRFNPAYSLRVGKLKGPIGLERLQSANAIAMIERAFPTELAPSRELGAQLFGELHKGEITYAIGAFNGAPDGRNATAVDADDNLEWEGRIFFEPWKANANALSGLGFGIAASVGDKDGSGNAFLPRYRSPGQQQFFNYRSTVAARGSHLRLSPQAYFYRNQLGLQAEYITSEQELIVNNQIASQTSLKNEAWEVTGSWVLTGEPASYKGVERPFRPFVLGQDGWGAFELVGRVGELDVDDDAFPIFADANAAATKARAYGLGLNWYLNSNLKLVLNHTHTDFDGGAAAGADRRVEDTVFTRLQFAF
ncbi:porin [Ahniella affigens]|uniref:Porin n=1 Tax=Ahniella affigens TaxID=2021234 RepID=A0A2P1PYK2_9GAMM|nr:porin [Ahniella affigens]AVP99918.1 porin [Ahniella affigens]